MSTRFKLEDYVDKKTGFIPAAAFSDNKDMTQYQWWRDAELVFGAVDFQTQQFNLTVTEQNIVQVLLDEGSKTAPQIQRNIGKTREHTSRLLKKLWQEGYIDRETHSIPYKYHPSNELKSRINFSTKS